MVLVAVGVAALASAVLWRSYNLQMVEGAELGSKSDRQTNREMTLRARRGSILDRNGTELAVSVDVGSIFANPRLIEDPIAVTRRLKLVLGAEMDEAVVAQRLSDRDRQFVWIARRVPPALAEEVLAMKLPGVDTTAESKRYYPLKARGGHVLGFVGHEGEGLEGLERYYDKDLVGGEYALHVVKDAMGRRMYLGDEPSFTELEGGTLVLSIDERIQYVVETELAHMVERVDARSGTIIVSDPHTGDILAMATSTREAAEFNPNRFGDYASQMWRNRAITDTFEPGSTFKSFVVAAALEEKVVDLDDVLDLNRGRLTIGDHTITDTHPEPRLSVRDVIKHSSNIGAYRMAKGLGRERFGDYIHRFGFGEPSGIALRGERGGVVHNPAKWPEITLANVAFGQGLTATHLQMHMALGAIANGGELMRPRMVKEVRDRFGAVTQTFPVEVRRRVVSEETARKTREALMSVVEEGGTGTKAALAYHKVGGKTGTAQKVDPRSGRYSEHLWVASFIGFVPGDDPALVITVVADEPRSVYYGGHVAGPTFSRVAEQILPLVGVYPKLPASERVAAAPAQPVVEIGDDGDDAEVLPVPPYVNGVDEPSLSESMMPMPSYIGMSLREVVRRSRELGHEVRVEGAGVVKQQWPNPGVYVGKEIAVRVRLGERGKALDLDAQQE